MVVSLGKEVRVLERRGGRGDISFYVNVPKDYHLMLGKPSSYSIQLVGDLILLLPVRSIVVEREHGYTLHNLQEEFEEYLEKIKPKSISCVEVNKYLLRNRIVNEGITEAIVFCINHKHKHKALIKYGNNEAEIIENGLSCGYSGTSPGATVRFIAYLSQRVRGDRQVEEVEKIVKDRKLRALKIEVDTLENKIIVIPVTE